MVFVRALCVGWLLFAGLAAAAPVIQVPEGGRAVEVSAKGVVCGPVRGGWALTPDGHGVRPPAKVEDGARSLELKVADDAAACATAQDSVTVIATGPLPRIDAATSTFFPDDGRVELKGANLKDLGLAWSGTPRGESGAHGVMEGQDVCLPPDSGVRPGECVVPVTPGLPTDAVLTWIPPHGRRGAEVITYDAAGNVVDPQVFRLRPGRVVLTRPLVQSSGIDLSKGPGSVAVSHSEALASVDCGLARCEVNDGAVSVRNVPGEDANVTLRLRLAPRILFARGDALEQVVTESLPVLACGLTAVEGTVLRDAESPALVLRLDASCAHDPRTLFWSVNGERARVERVAKGSDGVYVLVRTSGTSEPQVTITATSSRLDRTVVASETAKTEPLPDARATLELPGEGTIDFIPTNRPAEVKVSSNTGAVGRFVPRPVSGVYTVTVRDSTTLLQGEPTASGFVSLRFGYRLPSLPAELATADLVVVSERVQRAVREASVPTPVEQLVEFVCADKQGQEKVLAPSWPHRISFELRNTCRVVVHRERVTPERGIQEIVLRVDVTKPDGSARTESHVEQRMVLRPRGEPRSIPIQGALGQYDRILVQVSHVADESRYALSASDRTGLPSAQWTATIEGGLMRLYTMATIPAGLYRATSPSGQLTLNFGVLSRLVFLNNEGQERLVGLELGLMGLGLVPQSGDIQFPPTLAAVTGLGLRVPIGPGASVGVQAWVAREFRGDITRRTNGDPSTDRVVPSSRWSFIFGPSISVGNVGFNL
ncbi:hypothetical protein JGU66_06390 [Myxococcaceae bacterium JPH2]|nr:hypothetical protein [Myxococcaceae bacterium JPH2]